MSDTDVIRAALTRMVGQQVYDCGAACCAGGADGEAQDALAELSVLRGQLAAAETARDEAVSHMHQAENMPGRIARRYGWIDKSEADELRAALAAATTERDEATVGLAALGSVYRVTLDELATTRTALLNVLEWPLPKGTVEAWALPEWLAREARAALAVPVAPSEDEPGEEKTA